MQSTGAISLELPMPHRAQQRVLRELRRFNVVDCGRRWGKSLLGLNLVMETALAGYPNGWFAPANKYLNQCWRDLKRLAEPVTKDKSEVEHRLELITGGVIECWSLVDPDAGRSRKYKRVVVDEAAKVRTLESSWNEAIRPCLADYAGDAFWLSTPKGMDFFWRGFCKGQDENEKEWASWKMPTETNPYIQQTEIEAARFDTPERAFQQEWLAEFLDDTGGVFRGINAVIDPGRDEPEEPATGRIYTLGVDLARVEDFTVISVMDDRGRQVYHERFNQISWERQIGAILNVADRYKADVVVETNSIGDVVEQRLRSAIGGRVHGWQSTNASKTAIIDNLAMLIEQRRISLMDIDSQRNELLAYQYDVTASRNITMNAPEGMHDDCVIALALSCKQFDQRIRREFGSFKTKRGHLL
jgi:hypothetical protein